MICSLSTDSSLQLPPLYSVGPILHLKKNIETMDHVDVLKWLIIGGVLVLWKQGKL